MVVHANGESLVPTAPKPRRLLAYLMLNANQMVRASDCITELWGCQSPKSAVSTLQTYVLHIRQTMRTPRADLSETLQTQNQGYRLQVAESALDRCRFDSLVYRGRTALAARAVRPAAELFAAALDLWRGPVLSDVATGPMSAPHLVELEEIRQVVLEQRIEADLTLGRHRELIDELTSLAVDRPTHENVHAQLMVALYRSGQRARAGAVFQGLRRVLAETLGIEPSPRMLRLYRAVLARSPLLEAGALPLTGDGRAQPLPAGRCSSP